MFALVDTKILTHSLHYAVIFQVLSTFALPKATRILHARNYVCFFAYFNVGIDPPRALGFPYSLWILFHE